jgi:hypothetical protein
VREIGYLDLLLACCFADGRGDSIGFSPIVAGRGVWAGLVLQRHSVALLGTAWLLANCGVADEERGWFHLQ